MRIAIPVANDKLAAHFGHCENFVIIEVDETESKIIKREELQSPPHQPGLLPSWLAGHGTDLVIAGGMGRRALALFEESGIKVVIGVASESPDDLVAKYLTGQLVSGENICDH